jgi:hypothetical protein
MTHWYDKNEGAKFEVLNAKGLPRKSTLRDAKKEGWYPGVNDCLNVAPSYKLIGYYKKHPLRYVANTYKDSLGIKDVESWAKETLIQSEILAKDAPNLGTKIHRVIRNVIDWKVSGQEYPIEDDMKGYARAVWNFCDEHALNPIELEKTVTCSKHGYGGTVDYYGGFREHANCLIDWKTQPFVESDKEKGKFEGVFYDNFPVQLAAYAQAMMPDGLEKLTLVSVLIDRRPMLNGNLPKMMYKIYPKEKNKMYFDLFLCCRKLWASEMFNNWEPLSEKK